MNLFDLARQQEHTIPDARLVALFEKDFPIYRIELAVQVREPRGVSLLAHFLMRLMAEQVHDAVEMSQFLGVSYLNVSKALQELISLAYAIEVPTVTGRLYKLSSKGQAALEANQLEKVQDRTLTIKWDAISGKLYHAYSLNVAPLKADSGETVRPYYPYPTLWEISQRFSEIKELYKDMKSRHQITDKSELDDITGILNIFTEYRRLRVLVFLHESGEYRFQVFDRHHYVGEYVEPLMEMIRNGLEPWDMDSMENMLPLIGDNGLHPPRALMEDGDGEGEALIATPTERTMKELMLTNMEEKKGAADASKVYLLSTSEHFAKMQETLDQAEKEVVIISPWVSRVVIDELLPNMKQFLERGGTLWIGYGYPNEEGHKRKRTEETIQRLKHHLSSPRFLPIRLGDTHEKILICDEKFAVIGSYNWLSFRGDKKRGFVSETSVYVGVTDVVQQLRERTMRRLQKRMKEWKQV